MLVVWLRKDIMKAIEAVVTIVQKLIKSKRLYSFYSLMAKPINPLTRVGPRPLRKPKNN